MNLVAGLPFWCIGVPFSVARRTSPGGGDHGPFPYLAWLVIPLVVGSDLTPRVKTALMAFLGATPLLTKLIAIALLGRPTINFLKKHSFQTVSPRRSCRLNAGWRPLWVTSGRHASAGRSPLCAISGHSLLPHSAIIGANHLN